MRRFAVLLTLLLAGSAPAAAAAPPVVGGVSFNDAPELEPGTFSDAVDTGGTVFYRVELTAGQRLSAGASLDVSGFDASVSGASSLVIKLYDPTRQQIGEAQTLGPGDSTTHLKSTTATTGAVQQAGPYYLAVSVNDFLPKNLPPAQLPLDLNVGVTAATSKPATRAGRARATNGTSWAVLAVLALGGVVLGTGAGLAFRRR